MTTNLCTTSSIRAVLGVSEKEIRDDVLLEPIFAIRLTEQLLGISATLIANYNTTVAITPKTDIQQRFVDVTQAYSAYLVALMCCTSVPMFAPQTIADGKAHITRIADPYKNLRQDITETLAYLRKSLSAAYAALNPAATIIAVPARTLVATSPPGFDPVTGI